MFSEVTVEKKLKCYFINNHISLFLKDFSMECGICYAYRLNDLIPDKACDDSRCGQPFHSLCLYEVRRWFFMQLTRACQLHEN